MRLDILLLRVGVASFYLFFAYQLVQLVRQAMIDPPVSVVEMKGDKENVDHDL